MPALARSLGRRLPRGMTRGTGMTAALTAGAAGYGLAKGIGSSGITDYAFEMATGDPQFDQYAFGTDVGINQLLMPVAPSIVTGNTGSLINYPVRGAAIGGLAGAAAGFGLSRRASPRTRFGISMLSGAVGAIGGGTAGFNMASQGLVNRTTISDSLRGRRYNNTMPMVDGSLVLGAYNTRMGGY